MEELIMIKDMRRRLGITQGKLARMCGVSQSLIAKIESGKTDPAYSKVKVIMEALQREQSSKEKCAKDVMHEGIVTVSADETLHSAAAKMRKMGVSQFPVSDSKGIVGSITEQAIVAQFSGEKNIAAMRVRAAMAEAFPTALPSTPLSAIAPLLRHYPAVLVMEKGGAIGIITKADVLKAV